MQFSNKFVRATDKVCTFEEHVNAPCFRKSFRLNGAVERAEVTICGLGFYELYINGANITKGPLAPYISNPDDVLYYDCYDVAPYLNEGENVIGVVLGNGFFNPFGGAIWDFEKAVWIGPLRFALRFEAECGGKTVSFEADDGFRTHDSAILFDEYRMGTHYDARLELPGWNAPGFDDTGWTDALHAEQPRGEAVLCPAEPIVVTEERKPVSITKCSRGYIYDFGANLAGVCRLTVKGNAGQKISLWHSELLKDGELDISSIIFDRPGFEYYFEYAQKDVYICKGEGEETFVPPFTYHGFRYVLVEGIDEAQATESLLTYLVMNSDLKERGSFSCSDETVNLLQLFTRRSDLANFYYFPTDCPHREKNGWTGDASMSAEHMLLNLHAENSLREWMRNIRKAQREDGALPGIVPTSGWGFAWGNGPAWDSVIVNVPYYVYKYTGDDAILFENADMIFRYLNYITTRMDERGLIAIGLGDWLQPVKQEDELELSSPLEFTDSAIVLDMCRKAVMIFDKTGRTLQKEFAEKMHAQLLSSIRTHLIDTESMLAIGNCQTSQTLAIEFGIFTEAEMPKAYANLVKIIHDGGDFMDVGMIGARYVFHVLAKGGDADLALKMITRPEWPSYGDWVARGAMALWEDFFRPEGKQNSKNHHFFGDISAWFIRYIAGLKPNPNTCNTDEVEISPCFVAALEHAEAYFDAPKGRMEVCWKRESDKIVLSVSLPGEAFGVIRLPEGYCFADGKTDCLAVSGDYIITKK
ncbi:MAG TPA: family 78 glycoside hydrolase catalytic domain [Candidatus Aphodoplasma excrementigallinarum]|uniref:alpha-L-rhamnosidase n=1 Tax=Candidatus Aphodoplasma excrementigallinarum TaxID=2840673 RepID=A0A9D1T0N4_9FIRM|nr:family 78 glycoside hydrolase catalytic domain [Candidatus Aphodoplasma excrementigallinarum]